MAFRFKVSQFAIFIYQTYNLLIYCSLYLELLQRVLEFTRFVHCDRKHIRHYIRKIS